MINHKDAVRVASWVGAALLLVGFGQGCGQQGGGSTATADGVADSVAYAAALESEDGPARLSAMETLIRDHPNSKWSARAYPRMIELTAEHRPDQIEARLREFMKTDFETSEPYNAVGWHLAEEEQHLDLAIPILEKAVARARKAEDPEELASCLDSQAWALFKKGDHAVALEKMTEAYETYIDKGYDEIDMHMALISDAAGDDEKAKEIYIKLLGHMESPDLRRSLTEIVTSSGGSMDEVNAQIDAQRDAGATPVPDFTLPSLADGQPISIADYRGKVVLLNFWHPT